MTDDSFPLNPGDPDEAADTRDLADGFSAEIRLAIQAFGEEAGQPHAYKAILDGETLPKGSGSGQSRPERHLALAVAAAVLLLVAGGLLVSRTRGSDTIVSTGPVGGQQVMHEIVSYEQSYDVQCPGNDLQVSGSFDTMTIETWGPSTEGSWRQTISYPDGSSRTLIHEGNRWYPDKAFETGERRGQTIECAGFGILQAEPGQGSFFTLNPMAKLPTLLEGGSAVLIYQEQAELVEQGQREGFEETVQLWRRTTNGFYGDEPVADTREWIIDANDGRVLAKSYSQDEVGLGTVRWAATLVSLKQVEVGPNYFSAAGMTSIFVERPPFGILVDGQDSFVGEALEDGEVTFAELEVGFELFLECLRREGLVLLEDEVSLLESGEVNLAYGDTARLAPEQAEAACEAVYFLPLYTVYSVDS